MRKFTVSTQRKREIIDITEQIEQLLPDASGVCCVDMLDAFEAMMPKLRYRHPHNPAHVPDHILSSLIGTALTLPVQSGSLVLGTWQRVILVELDGARERELVLHFLR